eukprot:TRINITY_DN14067_c0_g1_i3.p1 TRINITY_DN14067_c0_g1~~TRINITY_DN14067_c0_g1_i3.p1  ORF type:complete len:319 (+),score=35.63 TRINITY_DN14067_c0_g1_i3:76-1032(+)
MTTKVESATDQEKAPDEKESLLASTATWTFQVPWHTLTAAWSVDTMLRAVFVFSAANCVVSPVTFALSIYGYIRTAYVVAIVHLLLTFCGQRALISAIGAWLSRQRQEAKCCEPYMEASAALVAPAKILGVSIICLPQWAFVLLTSIPDTLDPDMDGLIAGNSGRMYTEETQTLYEGACSWLPYLMNRSLPSMIMLSYAFAVCFQMYYLFWYRCQMVSRAAECVRVGAWCSREEDNSERAYARFLLWRASMHVADMGSLGLMSNTWWQFCRIDGERYRELRRDDEKPKHSEPTRGASRASQTSTLTTHEEGFRRAKSQ